MMRRAALIGCGRIGCEFDNDSDKIGIYTHAAAYHAASGVELWAVADPDAVKRDACGERYGIPLSRRYADSTKLLAEEKVDIISIAAPDAVHAEVARLALASASARAVLLEKPLALTVQEGRALLALAEKRKVMLAVNYSRRYCPAHRAVRDAIQGGKLGAIQAVQGYYSKGIRHNGSHWLDLLRWFFGPLVEIRATASGAASHEGDPTPHVQVRTESGVIAQLAGLDHRAFSLFEMDIVGELGRIRLAESGHRIEWYRVDNSPYYSGYRLPRLERVDEFGMHDLLLHAVEDLLVALDQGTLPVCDGADGLAALCAAEAAVRSLSSRSVQKVAS
ncbi:Predicted dehydrogenase [Formivibrio citricus]|uniref:Predicted dehydrogenase n=1 Tax=Formivibrio citricus TaxID=83765 RepID=A0A1I4VB80_9NEIS|nr:Gfo/Idh/MocA family oxidoreductase [Formivibrio citricus]SFM98435.1 Predicted dehydrogenase [Formivibrio citricus]